MPGCLALNAHCLRVAPSHPASCVQAGLVTMLSPPAVPACCSSATSWATQTQSVSRDCAKQAYIACSQPFCSPHSTDPFLCPTPQMTVRGRMATPTSASGSRAARSPMATASCPTAPPSPPRLEAAQVRSLPFEWRNINAEPAFQILGTPSLFLSLSHLYALLQAPSCLTATWSTAASRMCP